MAENKPTTPEQQLLKLIEGQGKAGDPGAAPSRRQAASVKRGGISLSGLRAGFLASLSFWKRSAKKRSHGSRPALGLGIAEINKVLTAATLALFVYVIFDAVASARGLQRPPNFAPLKETRAAALKESVDPLPEASYYLQKVSSRDIFKEGKKIEEVKVESPAAPVAVEDAEAVQSLALVGISWSANPDAIIEDKGKQRTYFVKRGQEVGDGVRVEAIFKDHVVVTFEDREYELR